MANQNPCRWGIMSTAAIAKKNWHSIANSDNARLIAVASRSHTKAAEFIAACQASAPVAHDVEAIDSYDALLSRDDIDAVYIPLPTALRTPWVIKAAQAGKHVMVEKPCGVHASDVQKMIDACQQANVQFMDGVMFMHHQRLAAMRAVIDDGQSIGEIRRIVSQFSFCAPDEWTNTNIRAASSLEPAGCLGDLGWYTIRFILFAMNYEMPVEVRGRILHSVPGETENDAVPMEFQGEMHFASGVSATFFNSFRTQHQQLGHISGTKGYLAIDDFVLPYFGNRAGFEVCQHNFVEDGCRFPMERHQATHWTDQYSNNAPDAQETNLFRTFSQLVIDQRCDPFWPEVTLKTQKILDAALASARNRGSAEKP